MTTGVFDDQDLTKSSLDTPDENYIPTITTLQTMQVDISKNSPNTDESFTQINDNTAYESNSQTEVVPIQGFQTVQADVSNSFNTDETYNEIEDNIATGSNNHNIEDEPIQARKRKRKANPNLWKRSIIKNKRLSGEEYTNRNRKHYNRKEPKPVSCDKCRYKCNEHFPDDVRMIRCQEYWKLGDFVNQKLYLSGLIENVKRVDFH